MAKVVGALPEGVDEPENDSSLFWPRTNLPCKFDGSLVCAQDQNVPQISFIPSQFQQNVVEQKPGTGKKIGADRPEQDDKARIRDEPDVCRRGNDE